MRGEAAISPILAGRMLEEFRRLSQHEPREFTQDETAMLTLREKDVLTQVAQGSSDKEIAAQLSISLHTVKSHLRNILAKLQVNSRREAARLARDKGLL
jgi:DNA-binding NarL/FixJ family response regulator